MENNTVQPVDRYFREQKEFAQKIADYIYSDFAGFNSMEQTSFTLTVDSLRNVFLNHLDAYRDSLPKKIINDELTGIKYFFDMLLLDYPIHHEIYTGKKVSLSFYNQKRLEENKNDFNNPSLLSNKDFIAYVKTYLHHQIDEELKKDSYRGIDNKRLNIFWKLSGQMFENTGIMDYWRFTYLKEHFEIMGIKNTQDIFNNFIVSCENAGYIKEIRNLYEEHKKGRENHLIKVYKNIDGYDLDIHLFLPDSAVYKNKRPVIVYFHGGSWTEGKPDWFFSSGKNYAEKGWVAAAVEYRIKSRHNTLPFESVKDARSAIRWLREHADEFKIDKNKIAAEGNSAGGHLVLAAALADDINEKTDNLIISSAPNALLVTSGVFDLTVENSKWIVKDLENKDTVKNISPNHLLKENIPPVLIIHGENDKNCEYSTAEFFVEEMKKRGNDIKFNTIKNAGHFIWFGKHAGEVYKIKNEFLENIFEK